MLHSYLPAGYFFVSRFIFPLEFYPGGIQQTSPEMLQDLVYQDGWGYGS
jgi:hypothetical protein